MLQPKWLLALVAVLLVASLFAFLAKWQLAHAIRSDDAHSVQVSERAQWLFDITEPGEPVRENTAGYRVKTRLAVNYDELVLIADRAQGAQTGYWLAAQAATFEPQRSAHITAVVGFAQNQQQAVRAANWLRKHKPHFGEALTVTGRYQPTDSPQPQQRSAGGYRVYKTLAPAQQLNLWVDTAATYSGYLVLDAVPVKQKVPGLTVVVTKPLQPVEQINWLNLFYAIEWVIFAGFAIYFWVRLCRDAQERACEVIAAQNANAQNTSAQNAKKG